MYIRDAEAIPTFFAVANLSLSESSTEVCLQADPSIALCQHHSLVRFIGVATGSKVGASC